MGKYLKRSQKGFSLVELIVVIAVLGTLSLILVPQFSLYGDKAMGTAALSDARSILSVAIAYNMDNKDAMTQDELNTFMGMEAGSDSSGSKTASFPAGDQDKIIFTYTRGGVTLRGDIDLTTQHIDWSITSGTLPQNRRQAIAEGLKINVADLG